MADAVALLAELLEDFPFTDQASRANAYALLLTPIVRRAIAGNVPLALVDAPQAGTGKSLLAEIVALIHTGSDASMQPAPARGDESEWRKTHGAVLSNGSALTIFDNVDHRLQSASLALAITAPCGPIAFLERAEQSPSRSDAPGLRLAIIFNSAEIFLAGVSGFGWTPGAQCRGNVSDSAIRI